MSKLSVLPCAADVAAFAPNGSAPHVRQALGLTTEPVVIWVGGFYHWHDLDILLEGSEVEGCKRLGVVEVFAHRVGLHAVLAQRREVDLFRPPELVRFHFALGGPGARCCRQ